MSHIVIDAREYSTSTGRYIYRMLQYLQHKTTEHSFTVLLKPEDMDKADFPDKNFTKVSCPHKEFTFAEQLGFKRQIDRLKPDLVHFGKDHQPVLYRRSPVVTTMHDLTTLRFRNPDTNWALFKFRQLVYARVVHAVAKKSAAILTPTQYVKDDVAAYTGVNPAKITVTYEAADAIPDAPEPIDTLQNQPFIMYVGRPTPHKNLWRLIQAFQSLHGSQPELKLVLAGKLDGNYRAIQKRVQDEQIANIIFTDRISEGQLRWLYEHCEAYLFPSLSEGFGLTALEAMIHGAPVVSSNATCLPEVYGDAAHYFDPLDTQSIADAIQEVLTNKQLRQELITKGKAQAAKYSWERMARQTLAVYNQVLDRK